MNPLIHRITLSSILIGLIKWGLPLLIITDLSSQLFNSVLLLNVSRSIRIIMLVLFIIENIRHINIIMNFYFSGFFFFFAFVHFLYLFTDPIFIEGLWNFSKMLFWILGINVLYVYGYFERLELDRFIQVIKTILLISLVFTFVYTYTGVIESEYNIAAYVGVFIYPLLLFSSDHFSKNKIYILICALVVLITVKRGAVLAFMVASIIYFFGGLVINFSLKRFVLGILFLLLIGFLGIYAISKQADRLKDRLSIEQFDIDNDRAGSGRVGLYRRLYNDWIKSDNILFGFGNQADSHRWNLGKTESYLQKGGYSGRRTHAHSDIFGYLYNYGIIGILLIFFLYYKVLSFYKRYRNNDFNQGSVLITFLAVLILVNLYSGLFRLTESFYLFALLPYYQLANE